MAKVFINPGHSLVNDAGATNKELNLQERYLTRDIGKALGEILQASGIQVEVYQQQKSLNDVPKKANTSGAHLFVSIHMNAPATTCGGVEVLYCEGSTKGKEVAQTILNHITKVGNYTFRNRGIKDDANRHLCVLRQTKMNACLVEMGFITYNTEATFVATHIEECAQAIANGIKEYLAKQGLYKEVIQASTSTLVHNKAKIVIVPSGVNGTFNLLVNDNLVLKANSLETIHKFIEEKYKSSLY